MKKYTVKRYQPIDYANWNDFIGKAKNATFLFHRDFMEYHNDRFQDYSLIVLDGEKWVAVLPANVVGNEVFSHHGLTYGGLVLLPKSKLFNTIFVFKAILEYLCENSISKLVLKQIPSIYCDYLSDEINYLMHICNGITKMKHNISVVTLANDLMFSKTRRECVNRGKKHNLIIKEEDNLDTFWNKLLIPNLNTKYNTKPVHSLEEIMLLKNKFPTNIRHFNVYHNAELVAGTTVFITQKVVKPQYISGSDDNNLLGSIDFLYDFLIREFSKGKAFFDFGPSHENSGLQIVEKINFWKESFGSHSLVQDFYEVETSNYYLLDNVLI